MIAPGVRGRLAAAAALALLLAHLAGWFGMLSGANARIFDRLMQVRNAVAAWRPDDDGVVVHVDIDDRSLRLFEGHPPDRQQIAAVMRTIGAVGSAAQAYDFVFAARQDGDEALVEAAHAAGNVYIGAAFDLADGQRRGLPSASLTGPSVPWRLTVIGDPSRIPEAAGTISSFDELLRVSRGVGSLNAQPDADGVFRRLPLVLRSAAGYYPSLALVLACGYLGVTPAALELRPGRSLVLAGARRPGSDARDIVIPVDGTGAMRLNFTGDWTARKHYAFADLWRDGMDPTAASMWEASLRGRIAVVADVFTGQADVGAVPVDSVYPLAGLHATAIHNIVNASFLSDAPLWTTPAAEVGALVLVWWFALARPRWLWLGAVGVAAGLGGLAAALFLYGGLIADVLRPLLAIVLLTAMAGTWRYLNEYRERELTRRTFESYFPPTVVARLLEDRGRLARSERKELTVLFSDIAGFTTRSAALPPERVQAFLSDYFARMVAIVFRHGGTVDKFIGDGLMVFFNDPEDQSDHAERCVRCAVEMQDQVAALSGAAESRGEPPVRVRMGIHTGPVVVGDLGSPQRLSYTAVGATVNLAQRLESAAPPGGILISADTAAHLSAAIMITPADEVRLKGLEAPVRVYHVSLSRGGEIHT